MTTTSWSWTLILNAPVADGDTVDVPTPGYDEALADPASAELAVDAEVIALPDKGSVTFNGDTATVANGTGVEWEYGSNVYVYVAARGASGDALEQIGANTDAIDVHSTDIAALQAQVTDHELRIAALEAAGTPATASAKKGKNHG